MRSSGKRTLVGALLATVLLVALLWWHVMLNPWSFDFPEHWEPADDAVSHPVFVYGSLTLAPVRLLVKGRAGQTEAVTLSGYTRRGLDINPEPGAELPGLLLEVSADELRRLDRYERLGVRYTREWMTLSDGTQAWVYRRLEAE